MLYNSLCSPVHTEFLGFATIGIIVHLCNIIYHIFVMKSLKHCEKCCHLNSLLNGKLCICEISKSKTDITTLIIVNSKYIFLDISVTFNIRFYKLCEIFSIGGIPLEVCHKQFFRKKISLMFIFLCFS